MAERRDLVAIGGSAGGLEAIRSIVRGLPPDLPAAVCVVIHMPATAASMLTPLLNRSGSLPAVNPRDGDPVLPGYIYAAQPDHHLELVDGCFRLARGPRVNGVRPAIDVLFRSAAVAYGRRALGVIVSGALDDGSAGLAAIKAAGGVAIVQAPEDAFVRSMPDRAIERAAPDHVLPAAEIAAVIAGLVAGGVEALSAKSPEGGGEMVESVGGGDAPGEVTGLTCPDCQGAIWVRGEPGGLVFACRIGHEYSAEAFVDQHSTRVDSALWAGVRALEEQVSLARFMAHGAERRGDAETAHRHEQRAQRAQADAEMLRALLVEQ